LGENNGREKDTSLFGNDEDSALKPFFEGELLFQGGRKFEVKNSLIYLR
jgi:hypothetical protein